MTGKLTGSLERAGGARRQGERAAAQLPSWDGPDGRPAGGHRTRRGGRRQPGSSPRGRVVSRAGEWGVWVLIACVVLVAAFCF